jgi:carbon storage regulator
LIEKKGGTWCLSSRRERGRMTAVAKQHQNFTSCVGKRQRGGGSALDSFFVVLSVHCASRIYVLSCREWFQVPLTSFRNQEAAQMQMITRRVNEGLVIGGDIHVTVLDICDDCVRLAISSPKTYPPYWEQTLYLNQTQEEEEIAEPLLLQ